MRSETHPSVMTTSLGAGVELRVVEEKIQKNHSWQLHETDAHSIIVHLNGVIDRVETELDGVGAEVAPLGAGDFSLLSTGHRYACAVEGGVVRHATLLIKPSHLRDHLRFDLVPNLRLALGSRDPFMYECIVKLAACSARSDDIAGMISGGLVQAIFGHLIERYGEFPRLGSPQPGPSRAEVLLQYVNDNLAARICLEDLAAAAEISPGELFEMFRREFQTTPAQYVIERRLQRAIELLTSTSLDITSIALVTGFSSHSHLTTTFKKRLGFAPSALRSERRMRPARD